MSIPLPGKRHFYREVVVESIEFLVCQSPYRGTGISTIIANAVYKVPVMCQSPYRGTGISTLLSQNALPERFSEVEIYRDCTFLYFSSKITGYFVKI